MGNTYLQTKYICIGLYLKRVLGSRPRMYFKCIWPEAKHICIWLYLQAPAPYFPSRDISVSLSIHESDLSTRLPESDLYPESTSRYKSSTRLSHPQSPATTTHKPPSALLRALRASCVVRRASSAMPVVTSNMGPKDRGKLHALLARTAFRASCRRALAGNLQE